MNELRILITLENPENVKMAEVVAKRIRELVEPFPALNAEITDIDIIVLETDEVNISA